MTTIAHDHNSRSRSGQDENEDGRNEGATETLTIVSGANLPTIKERSDAKNVGT
eukprot:CAMPEP_0185264832 /NCGR_PEP_ID=MMETSP1359-20130426/25076_1 /TAXON_ID=552665 /ORGANISM="Bigelowiella longifila, Strain CCMP242" /LENGTH=53 /DNA_ID=CAMNT_0027853691 /DNA_START=1135 /DNA_END=1292 /DNA_ORIENTATION=+